MDSSNTPFKSPRPPAPRKARGGSLSRQSSRQSLRDSQNGFDGTSVPPLPTLYSGHVGLGMNMGDKSDEVESINTFSDSNVNNAHSALQDSLCSDDTVLARGASAKVNNASTAENTTAASVLARLEGLLVAKSNEIQLAGRLGEALLSQQAELENRIRELEEEVRKSEDHASVFGGSLSDTRQHQQHKEDDDSDVESAALIDERVKEKLAELENEMMRWEKGNEEIYRTVGVPTGTSSELVKQASSATMRPDEPSTPSLPKSSSQNALQDAAIVQGDNTPLSPSQSRRQRNAQHRANDIEFATEIGQSLLLEVRRLQALLTERDAQLAASRTEKDGMERSMESLASGLKSVEDQLDKYREENWNLEVQNQEVRSQITELSANHSKTEAERNRLSKELASTRDALDGQKMDNERLAAQLETLKNKHETDMANMRRTTAGLQREKTDLQTALEAAKNEITLRARGIRRSVSATSANTLTTSESHHTLGGVDGDLAEEDEDEEDDVFGTGRRGTGRRKTNDHLLDSPSPFNYDGDSSLGSNASPAFKNISESEKLRGNLAHAQKTIQTLRAALTREKEAKMMLKRKLGKGLEDEMDDAEPSDDDAGVMDEYDDDDEVDENQPEKRRRTITAATARRGRGARSGIVASRRGPLVGRLPRGLQPSRLSSEVPSGDESADGSFIEHGLPRDLSMGSEQEELASLPGDDDMHQGQGPASMFSGSVNSLAGMDPAFADILPPSRTRDGAGGSTRDNRPNSMMFANDLNLMEQIKRQEEEIERLKALPAAPEPVETKSISLMTDEVVVPKVVTRELGMQTMPVEPEVVEVVREVIKEVTREVPVVTEVIKEVIKEVPVDREVIKEVPVDREVIKEVPVDREVIREVPVDREVIKEIIKEVPVEKEVIKEIIKEVPVEKEVIKEIFIDKEVIKEVPVEVIKEVPVEVIKEVFVDRDVPRDVPVDREVIKEVIKEVPVDREVIREVPIDREVIKEVIKEVPVEVEVIKEVIKEVPVEVEVIKEIIKEVPVDREVIKEVPVEVEVIKEVPVDREVIKEVIKEIEVIKEVIKEVPVVQEVIKEVPVTVFADVPAKESKTLSTQTEEVQLHTAEIATMTAEPAVAKDMETMTLPEAVTVTKDMDTMTIPKDIGNMFTQTEAGESNVTPAKVMVDIGTDPHVEWASLLKRTDHEADASANLSAMSFRGNDAEAKTPTLESTPTFSTKALPDTDEAELIAPNVPEPSFSHKMRRDDSSISHSFKSFSMRDTDYDTAAETDADFEDARDTLATFDTASPGLTKFANMSQSTIMHSARASSHGSDGESEDSHRPATRYRRTSRTRSREPTFVKEDVPPVPKPVMVEMSTQTDNIPTTMVTSPTMTPGFIARELPDVETLPKDKRLSVTSYGDTTIDSSDTARPVAPPGLVFLETVSPTVAAPPNSAATSLSPAPSVGDSEEPSTPISPSKPRTPKLSIPPPPPNPPSRETIKHSMSPTFKPPRPSSPPPKDLLQRAQTPTFLAPGSVSKKRASAINDGSATPGTPGQYGTMPLHRNEAHFGASPAPLPRNRQPTQPRATVSSTQLRNSTPGIRYQAASTEPNEFGRQGAVTPVNQMMPPPARYGSTRRRREQGHSSRASMSSMGSSHSRNPSIASSARTSDAGLDGLPTPSGAGISGPAGVAGSTDPAVIHAITQAMIGEFLFKYTRTAFTKGHSDKRHQRFFWIHPYTKTLYWSNSDPGAEGVNQSKAKSIFIAGVRVETDSNPYPPGLYQKSIVISTIGREIKLTAPTQERHEMWMMAINYLLAREDGQPAIPSAQNGPGTPSSRFSSLGRSVNRSAASLRFRQKSDPMSLTEAGVLVPSTGSKSNTPNDSTVVPRNRAGKNVASMYQQESRSEAALTNTKKPRKMSNATSLYKRSGTPAAEYEDFIAEYGPPRSIRSYRTGATAGPSGTSGKGVDESLEIIDRRDVLGAEDGYEGLENVRACCNGEHDVGKLSVSKKHHHHHHHHGQGYDSNTVKSSARSNSIASKASRRTGRFSAYSQDPPVPSLSNEPASPSVRDRSHSTTLRGLSSSLGSPSKSMQRGSSSIGSSSVDNNPFKT